MRNLSRQSLVNIISLDETGHTMSADASGQTAIVQTPISSSPAVSEAAHRLRRLEKRQSQGFEWNEPPHRLRDVLVDDVNGLSLSSSRSTSYLGISSVAAVVRVLVKILPGQVNDDNCMASSKDPSRRPTPPPSNQIEHVRQMSYHDGQRLIDAYFANVHVYSPMIHEPSFRVDYLCNKRNDPPWLALLNMVFALGSIASTTSESDEDIEYYRRAKEHLGLESFGSGRMETLQALTLMGGLYLHYRNRPNMASAIMGAAHRMACSLGLHGDFVDSDGELSASIKEINRRTWWSNCVLDSWGSTTLGRPPIVFDIGVEVPRNVIDDEVSDLRGPLFRNKHSDQILLQSGEAPPTQPTVHSCLIHSIELCKIVSRIQYRLQKSPILDSGETSSFDDMLLDWFNGLPSFMRSSNPCPSTLQDMRAILAWRLQNMRILIHRAVVLDATARQIPLLNLGLDEQKVVKKCRELAAESILSIKSQWRPNKISGWNAVWFLFQACLVPLMALAVEPDNSAEYQDWQGLVRTGINLCEDMERWSLVGRKTKSVLEKLFEGTQISSSPLSTQDQFVSLRQEPFSLKESFFGGEWNDVVGEDPYYCVGSNTMYLGNDFESSIFM